MTGTCLIKISDALTCRSNFKILSGALLSPLHKKVQDELTRMESLGVISRVETPTPWCAGMVIVPKKSGSVRICVDFRPLNKHVLREVHLLPKVDETLAQLTGAKVFSKLDANGGVWQIPLAGRKLLTSHNFHHTIW